MSTATAHYPTHSKPAPLPAKCNGYTSAQRLAFVYRARRKDAQRLDFGENWNHHNKRGGKLSNHAFTTLRTGDMQVGQWFRIYLDGSYVGDAIVVDSRRLLGDHLTDHQCYMDTGYNKDETLRILSRMHSVHAPSHTFTLATLVYIEPEVTTEPQSKLF